MSLSTRNGLLGSPGFGLRGNVVPLRSKLDIDAKLFVFAAGLTDFTQIKAINQLVKDLKINGLWDKMKAIYPFVGGTAFTHKFNLKDPRDADNAFRLSFLGGITHGSTGVKPNGSTGHANTFLNGVNNLGPIKNHISFYSRESQTLNVTETDIGANSAGTIMLYLTTRYNADGLVNQFFSRNTAPTIGCSYSNTDAKGFYISTRLTNTTSGFKTYKNGSNVATANGSTGYPNLYLYLFASNVTGSANFFTNRECAFSTIGDGLTDTDVLNLYNSVQAYQTTLGRQV